MAADGKHLTVGGEPWRARGVTYGSFTRRLDGEPFPEPHQVKRDMADIAAAGFNTVRTYCLPPADVLDVAADLGLRLLVGLHYRDWRYEHDAGRGATRRVLDAGRRAVDAALERLDGRRNILAVSVGNEVPADVVRAHGIARVEQALTRLMERLHAGHPDLLVTYSSYPTTEFLDLPTADLACFNVFLERGDDLRRYLRHLQVAVGERPLLVTELGLASEVHGEDAQAASIDRQLREVDAAGVAGA
ncbi:MAG TPA: hypothetical protein VFH45_13065, partial [Acidimicrobiales bacterium]|nr:hypothetical protein [Acidimicrobiales bacterium]